MSRSTVVLLACALALTGAAQGDDPPAGPLQGLDRALHDFPDAPGTPGAGADGMSGSATAAEAVPGRPAISAVPKRPNATSRGFRLPSTRTAADIDRELQLATWPSDIVRLADECLRQADASACEFHAVQFKRMAARPDQILQSKDLHLQKDAFTDPSLAADLRSEVRRAALGDAQAAVRIARFYQGGAQRPAIDAYRYEGWLQYAALLGDAPAAYELALHFRELGQPQLAALYEDRALQLGFVPPQSLTQDRK